MNIKNKRIRVYDPGIFMHIARKLGEVCDNVELFIPDPSAYPESPKSRIGTGIPEVKRIYSFWENKDSVDLWVFPDCYDGDIVESLRDEGRRVFGSGAAAEIELDRLYLKDICKQAGLPVGPYEVCEGVESLLKHLEDQDDCYIKLSYHRGDFETYHHEDIDLTKDWLKYDLIPRVGLREDEIVFIVEQPIKAICEIGKDDFYIGNRTPNYRGIGYEIKDRGIVEKIVRKLPPIMQQIDDALSPVFDSYEYKGFYSNELRITDKKEVYFTDATCRAGSPPSELMCEMYTAESYAKALWDVAEGRVPELDPVAEYGAEIILKSPFHEKYQLRVKFPPEFEPYVKLKNAIKIEDGHWVCVPNNNGSFFGAVVMPDNSIDEAIEGAVEVADSIKALELEDKWKDIFEEAQEQIEKGEEAGIGF